MKIYKALLFFVSVILLLAGLSFVFPVDGYEVAGYRLRFFDIETLFSGSDEDFETAELLGRVCR